jgi:two-component system sensor histidine kinase HydH
VTIRSALSRTFFWMLLSAITVTGALSFYEFRRSLESEIANNLHFGASAVMQRIDTFLFSQLENVRLWRQLEVMQDIRVNDVDKRLSHFLSDLQAGQGTVYRALLCADQSGRIVAASDPARIGGGEPVIADWQAVPGSGFEKLMIAPGLVQQAGVVVLRTPIPNAFGSGNIGTLYALLDWAAVLELLDEAVADEPRSVLLLDARGQLIGASRGLREHLGKSQAQLHWQLPAGDVSSYIHEGGELGYDSLLVGVADSSGYQHFKGLGWHILMVEPTSVSFRPVWRLMWAMLAVLLLTLGVGVWLSSRLAERIAQPIMGLTEFTRRFRRGDAAQPQAPATAISEVWELYRAYVEMIEALEHSREQIVRAGKLAVVGEMAATMAHEVRTPLGIVRSSAQLLERQSDLGDKEHELIGFIVSETERLNRLVTMLLECARPAPPNFKTHDLHAIIDNVLSLLESKAEKGGVQLLQEFEAKEALFDCDREQMMQVLLNLVLNALQFVPNGGKVVVSTHREADALWLSVADDGPGIPPEMRERIFDPFYSRRDGGIGLGLTIVQQIVNVHRGEISASESRWGGAAFNIRFETEQA